jgi:hypothetical protein
MANAVLGQVAYEPIRVWNTAQGLGFPPSLRKPEAATQTFKQGVPLSLSPVVDGFLREATFAGADIIYGVSQEAGHNLATSGVAQQESEGTPNNQPAAVITAPGAWPRDGLIGLYEANGTNIFSISLKVGQVFTQALIVDPATLYRLIKDGVSGFWYLDNTLTGGNAGVAILLGVDPSCPNTVAGGCRVFFQFAEAKRFFQ